MALVRLRVFAASIAAAAFVVSAAQADTAARPPVAWLKGEGNFTKSHRPMHSIDKIVVHVTEGAFWGSVQWLKNPRAHASSHFVIARSGKIVQLVHLSDIAWHAGHWKTNAASVGIEHEGFTYGPGGFSGEQYRSSARLTAWIARRSLLPIDRAHIIGHDEVPDRNGGRGGASHHTDPGPNWQWDRYLRLVRRYAVSGFQKLSVTPIVPTGPVRGVIPWRAKTTGGIGRVEFSINGRVVRVDRRAPFAYAGGLNTTTLGNGTHVLQVHGIAGPGRYDIARRTIIVDNKAFALTSAGARPWTKVHGQVKLRVRPWGAKAATMAFLVDGRRRAVDRQPPFLFAWNAARVKAGKHVLQVVATSVDGRVAKQRIPLVAAHHPVTQPKPKPLPTLTIAAQSVTAGQQVSGLVLWRVDVVGPATKVEFWIDGVVRGADVGRPFTFGWDTASEASGEHRLEARALASSGRRSSALVTVAVAASPPG